MHTVVLCILLVRKDRQVGLSGVGKVFVQSAKGTHLMSLFYVCYLCTYFTSWSKIFTQPLTTKNQFYPHSRLFRIAKCLMYTLQTDIRKSSFADDLIKASAIHQDQAPPRPGSRPGSPQQNISASVQWVLACGTSIKFVSDFRGSLYAYSTGLTICKVRDSDRKALALQSQQDFERYPWG